MPNHQLPLRPELRARAIINHKNLKRKSFSSFLLRAFILISFKETYLFFRNLYGLIVHPFKTTAGILAKPDKSQTFLIFGLPAYLWLGAFFLFIPAFWFIRNWYGVRILSLLLFYSLTLLLFFLACYLFYWVIQYFYRCRLKPKP